MSSNHRSGNGPFLNSSPTNSPRRPLLPFYATMDNWTNRKSFHRRRHLELSLGQMMMNHRGSLLSTASLALVGTTRRTSKSTPDISTHETSSKPTRTHFWTRARKCSQHFYEHRLKHFLPLLILLGYSFLGGAVVYWIESPIERLEMEGKQRFLNDQKDTLVQKVWQIRENHVDEREALRNLKEAVNWYTIITMWLDGNLTRLPPPTTEVVARVGVLKKYTNEMAKRCWEINIELNYNRSDVQRKIQEALEKFEQLTGVTTRVKPIWTFSNALFLAVTIYTTIGYGSVAPHTVAGRVATIIYAIIGIPIYLMILHKLGRVFLKLLRRFWNLTLKFCHYIHCVKYSNGDFKKASVLAENGHAKKSTGKDNDNHIPVSLAVGVTFVWMLTCAGVCCLFFETSWDYFTSFYFFFISLTTIGFGDVTPTHPEYMFTMFGLIIVGLSLVSMCINVVQLKLELLFEEMMLTLMEEYEKTGQFLDGDITESALFQRGLGFVQMMKLWARKPRKTERVSSDSFNEFASYPLNTKIRRGAFLRDLQRRRRARTTCTQTEFTRTFSYDRIPQWMQASFERRKLRKFTHQIHQSTQTDWPDDIGSDLIMIPVINHSNLDHQWTNTFAADPVESGRSASSSMITCDDNGSVFVNFVAVANEPDDPITPNLRIARLDPPMYESALDTDSDESGDVKSLNSRMSPDLLPFIPYIEQEVPVEQEQTAPRRWSAAEAMNVFANWAAARGLGKDHTRQSRCSSDGDDRDSDEKLAHFRDTRKLSGRRVTVAVAAPQSHPSSYIRRKHLDHARSRAAGQLSTLRIPSGQPSMNDMKTLVTTQSTLKPIGHTLTVGHALESRKTSSTNQFL